MNTWFDNWVIWFDGYVHSIGFHFYTIPAFAVGILAIIMGLIHWRNQKKRVREGEEKRQEELAGFLTAEDGVRQ